MGEGVGCEGVSQGLDQATDIVVKHQIISSTNHSILIIIPSINLLPFIDTEVASPNGLVYMSHSFICFFFLVVNVVAEFRLYYIPFSNNISLKLFLKFSGIP